MRVVLSLAISSVLVLTGCATSPMTLPGAGETSQTSESTEKSASVRGTNYCVQNNSSLSMKLAWRGFPEALDLPPAATLCNSGWESGSKNDVDGSFEFPRKDEPGKVREVLITGDNPSFGKPSATAWFGRDGAAWGACGWFGIGDSEWFETEEIHATLTRIDDSEDNKEFVLDITDATGNPSALNETDCVEGIWGPL